MEGTIPLSCTITVYIPSYNQIEYLGSAIESVFAQTRLPDQILTVDDASTDGSSGLIRDYQRKHPKLIDAIFNPTNLGIGSTRRIAVNAAKGDLITYLDSDDIYLPRKLELEERALNENPQAGFAYSNFHLINAQGAQQELWATTGQLPSGDVFELHSGFRFPRGIASRCELVRRELLLKTDHYESGLNLYQVLDAMLRITRMSTCVAIDEPTHAYRRHAKGAHRYAYTTHYDTLHHIYTKNKNLLDGFDARRKRMLFREIEGVLASYAWRAIKQMSNDQPADGSRHQVLQYAKAGFAHRPSSVLNPKHTLRILRVIARS